MQNQSFIPYFRHMSIFSLKKHFVFLISLIVSQYGMTQQKIATSGLNLDENVIAWYDQTIGIENTSLQIGILNNSERVASRSHPYFQKTIWIEGSLIYRGQMFENISLLYDIHKDQLMVKNSGDMRYATQPVQLIKNQVTSFTAYGSYFEMIPDKIELFENDFFEILHRSDSMALLAKRLKTVEIETDGVAAYIASDKYYVQYQNEYKRIYRKYSVIQMFPEHKKEIRTFIRKNNLQILKPNSENHLTMLIAYCDELISE